MAENINQNEIIENLEEGKDKAKMIIMVLLILTY